MAAQDRGVPAPQHRTQLRDLVTRRKGELGLSYVRLEARCIDPETGQKPVSGSWLHRLVTGLPITPPDFPMLRALAAGIDVPLGVVQDAAGAEFFGIDVVKFSESGEARALVEEADKLTPAQREQIRLLIRSFNSPG